MSASIPAAFTAARERKKRFVWILIVYPDPAFDGHRNSDICLHCDNAISDQRGLRHQTGTELSNLHPI